MSASTTDQIPLEGAPAPGLGDHAMGALSTFRQLVGDGLRLFGLEARLAGLSLAGIIGATLAAAFSLMAAWLLMQAAVVIALMRLGADLLLLLAVLAVLNGAAGFGLLLLIRRLSRNLMFRATGQALAGSLHAADT